MHHPTDVAAGVLVGIGTLVVAVAAARVSGAAVDKRRARS
jgi:membrane-associated phospholipid phosphatase